MRSVAPAYYRTAPEVHEKLWRTVKDSLAKSDEHLMAAGKALLRLKADHDALGGSWTQWEKLLKEKAGIGKSRASELMQIAKGATTAEEVRADTAARKAKHEEGKADKEPSPFQNGGNAADAASSAEVMKAHFSVLDAPSSEPISVYVREVPGEPMRGEADPPEESSFRLTQEWNRSDLEARRDFVNRHWEAIKEVRSGISVKLSPTDENR